MQTVSPPSGSTDLLPGIEAELKRCLDLLLRIEDEVLPIVTSAMSPSLRAALQDIDLLAQCLNDIARCVHGLSNQGVANPALDVEAILSTIRLQDMRIRLGGGSYDARKLAKRDEVFAPPAGGPTQSDPLLF